MEQKGLVVGAELAPSVLAPSVEKAPPSAGWNQSTHATDGPHLHHSPTGVMEHGEKRIWKWKDLQM